MTGDEKHEWAAASTLDVLWVLYDRVLDVSPGRPSTTPDRDRFLLSKGHGPMAYYAVLAAKGFLDPATLDDWTTFGSPLGQHPDRMLVPGVEIGSGSLGHGLGARRRHRARAACRRAGTEPRVFVLVGDGELDEGSNHEAIALAGRLGARPARPPIAIDNGSASHGWPGGIAAPVRPIEGWHATTVDGRDHDALYAALTAAHPAGPNAVVATIRESR